MAWSIKVIAYGTAAAVSVLMVMLTLFLYWRFIDVQPPIQFYQSFGVNLKEEPQKTFRAGETLYAFREFTYTRAVPGTVQMQIVEVGSQTVVVQFKDAEEHFERGRYTRSFAVPIPGYITPGQYVYHVTISYNLNPIALPVVVTLPPIYFTVVK